MAQRCKHLAEVRDVQPKTPDGCEECLQTGEEWVHLRLVPGVRSRGLL